MDRGVTIGDYTVNIGKGVCSLTDQSLSASSLRCIPPKPIPEKSEDSTGKYHSIKVNFISIYLMCKLVMIFVSIK